MNNICNTFDINLTRDGLILIMVYPDLLSRKICNILTFFKRFSQDIEINFLR